MLTTMVLHSLFPRAQYLAEFTAVKGHTVGKMEKLRYRGWGVEDTRHYVCLDGGFGEGHTEVVRISQLKVVQSLKRQKRNRKN